MGRGHTVYNFRCTVHRRSLHGCSGCAEARSIFPLHRMHLHSSPGTKKIVFFTAVILPTPMDSYRICLVDAQEAFTIAQMSLSIVFGRHFVTHLETSIPCDDSPVPPHRYRSLHSGRCTDPNHEIDAPRDERIQHSRHRQQGHGDIFRTYSHVPFRDRDYVCCDEGEILCTDVRARRVLTAGSTFLAGDTFYTCSVSGPHACSYGEPFHINYSPSFHGVGRGTAV